MRIHNTLVAAAARATETIFEQKRQSEDAVAALLKSDPRWGSRDRQFLAENVYDVVRFRRWYEWAGELSTDSTSYYADLIGVRLLLTDDTPEVRAHWAHLDADAIIARAQSGTASVELRESIPDWLHTLGSEQLGAAWEAELHALNEPAKFCLRVNTLLTTRDKAKARLQRDGVVCDAPVDYPDLLVPEKKLNLRNIGIFNEGHLEVQDASSQRVAPLMQLQPGMRVLDACAGAGGKTLHMATFMQNRGSITATDVNEQKLKELERRAKRGHVRIITARKLEDGFSAKHHNAFDRVLLDVPCSSLGVMRRKPDLKWTLTESKMEGIIYIQAQILRDFAPCVKVGGLLVYSTCSILPMENEEQKTRFLDAHPGFSLLSESKVSPSVTGYDGFYICVMRRDS
jgi:16S rRNA (cytosine967-C5)-methyltransferase